MMRGMFAAISGLKSHQVMLDVTANDIANVNTIGYKSRASTFAGLADPDAARRVRPDGGQRRLQRRAGRPRRRPRLDRQPDDRRRAARRPATRSTSPSRATASSSVGTGTPTGDPSPIDADRVHPRRQLLDQLRGLPDHAGRLVRRRLRPADGGTGTGVADPDPDGRHGRRDRPGRRRLLRRPGDAARASPPATAHAGHVPERGRPRAQRRQPLVAVGQLGRRRASARRASAARASRPPARSRCPTWTSRQTFTNMITAQRGFQANSRVISTADEMLQDLVNLKR